MFSNRVLARDYFATRARLAAAAVAVVLCGVSHAADLQAFGGSDLKEVRLISETRVVSPKLATPKCECESVTLPKLDRVCQPKASVNGMGQKAIGSLYAAPTVPPGSHYAKPPCTATIGSGAGAVIGSIGRL